MVGMGQFMKNNGDHYGKYNAYIENDLIFKQVLNDHGRAILRAIARPDRYN